MHTDNDAKIADLIAQRENQRQRFVTDEGDAQIINNQITDINLQIMKLTAEAVKSLLTDAGNASALKDAFAGIEEKIVWKTKDGKTWDKLEDALAHQRRAQIIDVIYTTHGHDGGASDAVFDGAELIATHAAEIFALLEPFFRKGE